MSQIPTRTFPLNVEGQEQPNYFVFRANHRAWHTLERLNGVGLFEWLAQFGTSKQLGPWHELAWALSSTYREKMANPPDFKDFLDMLPGAGDDWNRFVLMLSELVREAFPAEEPVKKPVAPTKKTKSPSRRGG